MADRWAVANGNWSSTATWNGGTLPQTGDVVRSNGYTVTIDQNVTVTELRNDASSPAVAGGQFVINSGVTVTANISGYSNANSSWVSCNAGDQTIIGNIASNTNSGWVVIKGTSGTLTVNGNITASTSNTSHGLRLTGSSSAIITGNVTGGTIGGGGSSHGIWSETSGTLTINGNVIGTTGAVGSGVQQAGTGALTVNGNVTGGTGGSGFGIECTTSSLITINGNVTGNLIEAISVTSSSTVTVSGTISSIGSAPGYYSTSRSAKLIMNGDMTTNSAGTSAIARTINLISPSATLTHTYRTNNAGSPGVARSLYTGGQNLGQPTVANVRQGTTFGVSNEFTGTLVVPDPQYVSAGVLTDNTVGTLQHLTLSTLQAALSPNSPVAVERSVDDTKAIVFSWPVSGATIAGQKSVDNGSYTAVVGSISFLRTESGRHYYTLAYNAADRVTQEATIRYSMTDGTYTKYFNLRLVPPGINQSGVRSAVGLATANLDTQLGNIRSDAQNIQTRLPASLVNGRINASVGSMEANTLNASALASDAVTEIQAGLATSNQISNLANNLPTEAY